MIPSSVCVEIKCFPFPKLFISNKNEKPLINRKIRGINKCFFVFISLSFKICGISKRFLFFKNKFHSISNKTKLKIKKYDFYLTLNQMIIKRKTAWLFNQFTKQASVFHFHEKFVKYPSVFYFLEVNPISLRIKPHWK